jgi:hypothetical protein
MNAPDNVIQFPVAKSNSHYSDLYYVVVYSNDEGVVTGCHCLDCGVVHICGYLSIGSEMYELVEELDSNTLLDGSRNYLTLDDHIDLVVGRLNRRQHKVWHHSMLSGLD